MRYFNTERSGWVDIQTLPAKQFLCGHCGSDVSPNQGYHLKEYGDGSGSPLGYIYICHKCGGPTFFPPDGGAIPGPMFGSSIAHLPDDVEALYAEARRSASSGAPTAAVLSCRKILMHIAVDLEAKERKGFMYYVDYLADQGYVPPNGRGWVDYIRQRSNQANHRITIMSLEDAELLIRFVEMILKFIYEFPNLVPQKPKDA